MLVLGTEKEFYVGYWVDVSCQLWVMGCEISGVSCRLSVICYGLSVMSYLVLQLFSTY